MRKQIPTGIIGMVHLKALPGSPNFAGDLSDVERIAIADASTLLAGGVDAILVENFGDVPFQKKGRCCDDCGDDSNRSFHR